MSAFGALPNLADALTAPHPLHPGARPIVDFPALALGMPALLVGVKVGTLVNKSAPAHALALLLVLLYGWGAADLSVSYARLLRRERDRDALLLSVRRRLERSATLERVLSGAEEAGEEGSGELAALLAEWGVEEGEGKGEGKPLPPAAALGRRAQAPLLVPAGKALHADRLAQRRDLAPGAVGGDPAARGAQRRHPHALGRPAGGLSRRRGGAGAARAAAAAAGGAGGGGGGRRAAGAAASLAAALPAVGRRGPPADARRGRGR